MFASAVVSRVVLSTVMLAAMVLCSFVPCASADSIRVDSDWYVDVYVGESAQFYHILFPKDGTSMQVSKKRQDISAPRFSKDPAERARLKAAWEARSKEKKLAEERDIEIRVQTRELAKPAAAEFSQPRAPRRVLTPEEEAAEEAAWQQVLEERRMAMEERQRILDERAGIYEPEVPEEMPMETDGTAPESGPEAVGGMPTPPGPRAKPEIPARPAAEEAPPAEEVQQMESVPYFQNEQERYYYEQQRLQEQERLQAEAYAQQEQMESQGYIDATGYMAIPVDQAAGNN